MLSFVILSVIMLSVDILSVVAPVKSLIVFVVMQLSNKVAINLKLIETLELQKPFVNLNCFKLFELSTNIAFN